MSPDLLVDRQRLPGQRGLVDAEVIALGQRTSAGVMLPRRHEHHVAGTSSRAATSSTPVAQDARLERQPRLERLDGVVGLESCQKPTPALISSIVMMMAKSAQSPSTATGSRPPRSSTGSGPRSTA